MPKPSYETGAREPKSGKRDPHFDQNAAGNKPPKNGQGNSQPVGETNEKTRQSDGKRSGDTMHDSGAGPAIAERSKDTDRR